MRFLPSVNLSATSRPGHPVILTKPQKVIDDLHRKIGQLQVERDFLAGQPAISRLLRGGR